MSWMCLQWSLRWDTSMFYGLGTFFLKNSVIGWLIVVQQCAKLAKQMCCTHRLWFTIFSYQKIDTAYKHRLPCHWFTAMRGYELWPCASIYTLPYPLFFLAYLQTILSFCSDIFLKMLYFVSQIFASFHNSVSVGKSAAHGVMQLHEIWLLSVTKWSISIFSSA